MRRTIAAEYFEVGVAESANSVGIAPVRDVSRARDRPRALPPGTGGRIGPAGTP